MTTKANDIQVGGTHYQNGFQHWDLVAKYHLGYFEGQVSKYITRHRSKNGKQDVDKALHFLNKMIEVAQVPFIPWWKVLVRETWYYPQHDKVSWDDMDRYSACNQLDHYERVIVEIMCTWETVDDLRTAANYIRDILHFQYEEVEGLWKEGSITEQFNSIMGGADPTSAYVNQDRSTDLRPLAGSYPTVDKNWVSGEDCGDPVTFGHSPAGGHS
jgi:hypothetical protein